MKIDLHEVRVRELEENERDICFTSDDPWYRGESREYILETDGENPQHVGVLNAFAAHILRGEPLIADGREGIRGLLLSNAMHLSSWLDKPVSIPFDEQLFKDLLMERCAHSRHKEETDITFDTKGTY